MHRILLVSLLAAVSLFGQVTVTDTLKVAAGNQNFNGTVVVTSPTMTYSGTTYLPGSKSISVSNGAFTTTLWPNVGATPTGTTYRVTYTPRQVGAEPIAPWTEVWEVDTSLCTSPTVCTVAQIRKASAISSPSGNVLTNPMTTNGDLIYWNNGLKRLAIGSAGQHLVVSAGLPAWAAAGEPAITAGTTGQYWRGDKSWQTLDKSAVGLGNVENTALSTWAGSANITTLGTISTGTVPYSLLSSAPWTISGSDVTRSSGSVLLGGATNLDGNSLEVLGGIASRGSAATAYDGFTIRKNAAISSSNIHYAWSHRDNDKDLWLYSTNGSTFKNWIKVLHDTNAIDFADGRVTLNSTGIGLNGSTSGTVTLRPAAIAGTYTLILPSTAGTNGYCLKTDGTGTLSWGVCGTGSEMPYPGAGIAVSTGSAWSTSVAIGTDIQAYDADLAAVAGLSTAGIVARTGAGTAAARTIQAGSLVSVTNGDGASGDPSIDVDDTVVTTFLSGTADPTGACTMGTKYHRTDTDETWECPNTAWVKQLGSSHVHAAADTTSGTFDAARIPTLAGSKIDSADKLGTGDKFPMATALGTSGNCVQWGAAGLTDAGAPCGTGSGGGTTGLYSGTIDFGSIADGSCASGTFTATGLTTGKTLALSLPSGIDAGLVGTALASAADTAQVRLCNFSGAAVDPASAVYKVREMDALGYLTGSAAVNLGEIPDGGSVTTTITVTGASTGDNVAPGWPSALNTGLSGVMYVSAANTVTVRVFNWSGAAVDPDELTYAVAITK